MFKNKDVYHQKIEKFKQRKTQAFLSLNLSDRKI